MRNLHCSPLLLTAAAGLFGFAAHLDAASPPNAFAQENYVSDLPGANHLDPNLANPWGIAFSPTGPFWISDNKTGLSTVYDSEGAPFPTMSPLVVTIPGAPGSTDPGTPTGIVFNGGSGFDPGNGAPSRFIFATEDGTISGWNGAAGNTAILRVDNSPSGTAYKGLALAGNNIYAADFVGGKIDTFDNTFAPTLAGAFTDPGLPSGYAPFNIQNIGGDLYVSYAIREAGGIDDVAGPGNGIVNVFDTSGNLLRRLITGGELNSPWGLTVADASFGPFGGDLLVGNFGDGRINAYDPATGAFIDSLRDSHGNPIVIEGLWALTFGNGGNGGDTDELYFTAGISGGGEKEDHGLFGELAVAAPDSGAGSLALLSSASLFLFGFRKLKLPS